MPSPQVLVRTLSGDVPADQLGRVLAHEHVYAAFGAAGGDEDLNLVDEEEIVVDLRQAREHGWSTLVEVTAIDMGADVARVARLAECARLHIVKSVGWFRSPSADPLINKLADSSLTLALVEAIERGSEPTRLRAGVLGEVGITGVVPTETERRVLKATAEASLITGSGIVLHTDDHANGQALVTELRRAGTPADRLLVGHLRAREDPLAWHLELLATGCWLAFDQLGHPRRDPVNVVCERVLELLAHDGDGRIVLSSDVGRRSRLTQRGGSGYGAAVTELLAALRASGVKRGVIDRLEGAAMSCFLALRASP